MSLTDGLEKLGEAAVRRWLQHGHLGNPASQTRSYVQEWLQGKELVRAEARASASMASFYWRD